MPFLRLLIQIDFEHNISKSVKILGIQHMFKEFSRVFISQISAAQAYHVISDEMIV